MVDAAEVAAIGETENATIEFERNVDMHIVRLAICFGKQFFRRGEPEQLAIEAEMKHKDAPIEFENEIFPMARNGADLLFRSTGGKCRWLLWLYCNRVKHMNAANLSAAHQRVEGLSN